MKQKSPWDKNGRLKPAAAIPLLHVLIAQLGGTVSIPLKSLESMEKRVSYFRTRGDYLEIKVALKGEEI